MTASRRMPATSYSTSAIGPDLRLAQLDGLRSLLVFVALYHFYRLGEPRNLLEGAYRMMVHVGGMSGMEMFFVLSGFLITGILLDSKGSSNYFGTFYARRFLRIFPVYYGFLAVWILVLPRLLPEHHRLFAIAVERQLFYWTYSLNLQAILPPGFNGAHGLHHLWSLMVEEQFYLIWPAVVGFSSRARLKTIICVLLFASPALRLAIWYARPDAELAGYNFTLSHCEGLALGALLAIRAREPGGLSAWRKWAPRAALISLPVIFSIYLATGFFSPPHFWSQTLGVVAASWLGGAVVLATLTAGPSALGSRLLAHPLPTTVGKYSYAIYVLHWPASRLLDELRLATFRDFSRWMPGRLSSQLAYAGSRFLLAFLLAALSWHLVEKRVLALKRHFRYDFRRSDAPAAASTDSASRLG